MQMRHLFFGILHALIATWIFFCFPEAAIENARRGTSTLAGVSALFGMQVVRYIVALPFLYFAWSNFRFLWTPSGAKPSGEGAPK